jgi:hypothetical protein
MHPRNPDAASEPVVPRGADFPAARRSEPAAPAPVRRGLVARHEL